MRYSLVSRSSSWFQGSCTQRCLTAERAAQRLPARCPANPRSAGVQPWQWGELVAEGGPSRGGPGAGCLAVVAALGQGVGRVAGLDAGLVMLLLLLVLRPQSSSVALQGWSPRQLTAEACLKSTSPEDCWNWAAMQCMYVLRNMRQ